MSAQADSQGGLIDQLENALGNKDLARRAEVLRRVTDLFVLRSGSFSDDQIALFDVVMGKLIVEAVTDVLVERGNNAVVSSTAHNAGAKFSEFGVSTLIRKARDDGDLALCVWSRPDIPRQNLVKLFVDASEAVKNQLVEADPRRAELIKSMVAQATDDIQTKARAASNDFSVASDEVRELNAAGKLNEPQLLAF